MRLSVRLLFRCASGPCPEGHLDRELLAVTKHLQLDRFARHVRDEQHVERVRRVDALAVEVGDDVTGLEARRFSGAARLDEWLTRGRIWGAR